MALWASRLSDLSGGGRVLTVKGGSAPWISWTGVHRFIALTIALQEGVLPGVQDLGGKDSSALLR